jgi:hypothetical protein
MDGADPGAMRALTHPLRLDLLELLAANGPATAAACGRALGAPQANCSFHLRQLAKYGYVEEADQGADKRERRWRLTEGRSSMRFGRGSGGIVGRRLERLVVERETQAILDHVDRGGGQGPEGAGAGILAGLVAVNAEEAAELKRRWRELIEPYLVTTPPTGAAPATSAGAGADTGSGDGGRQPERRHLRVFMAMTPMASITSITSITGTDHRESGHEHEG